MSVFSLDQEPEPHDFPRLAAHVGNRFLAYVTASEEADIHARLEKGVALHERAETTLKAVLSAVLIVEQFPGTVIVNNEELPRPIHDTLYTTLVRYISEGSTSWANLLRRSAGGDTFDVSDEADPILQSLLQISLDLFPLWLISEPAPRDLFMAHFTSREHSIFGIIFNHPGRIQFEQEIVTDGSLAKLYPERDDTGPCGAWIREDGSGSWPNQPVMLLSGLLSHVGRSWELLGDHRINRYVDLARQSIKTMRQLAAGEQVRVPVLVGFSPIKVEDDFRLDVLGVLLRAPSGREHPDPGVTPGLVMETTAPFRLVATTRDKMSSSVAHEAKRNKDGGRAALEQKIRLVSFALLMSGHREQPTPVAAPTWQVFLDPASNQRPGLRDHPPTTRLDLTSEREAEFKKWIRLLEHHYSPKIDVAIERILMAVSRMHQPHDSLIDAWIALENLVGSKQGGESTFRVSSALAKLLVAEGLDIVDLQKKVQNLYSVRSNLVHGVPLSYQKVLQAAHESVRLALDAFASFFEKAPSLLDDPERGKHLILKGILTDPDPRIIAGRH